MRAVLIAVVALLALPAVAQSPQGPLVVVEREPLQQRLNSVNEKLSEAIGRAKKDKKLLELLEQARAELADASKQVAGAPDSKLAEEGQRAAIGMVNGMMSGTMGMMQGQMEADRRDARRREREDNTQRQEVVVVHKYEPAPVVHAPPPPPPPSRPMVYPIQDSALRSLLGAIESESFSQEQLTVLGQAAPNNYFVVGQVQQILERFTFSNDKLEAMRLLKPRTLDLSENGFKLYSSFEFSNDKEQLKKILAQ
jgi:hypothetical protein